MAALASNMAEVAREQHDLERANELLEFALEPAAKIGNFRITHILLREQGTVLGILGKFDRANAVLCRAIELSLKHSDLFTLSASFSRLA